MGKEKKEKKGLDESKVGEEDKGPSYEERLQHVSIISEPMASKKLSKKVSGQLFDMGCLFN